MTRYGVCQPREPRLEHRRADLRATDAVDPRVDPDSHASLGDSHVVRSPASMMRHFSTSPRSETRSPTHTGCVRNEPTILREKAKPSSASSSARARSAPANCEDGVDDIDHRWRATIGSPLSTRASLRSHPQTRVSSSGSSIGTGEGHAQATPEVAGGKAVRLRTVADVEDQAHDAAIVLGRVPGQRILVLRDRKE